MFTASVAWGGAWAWAGFTLVASGAQTFRNIMQRDLIATLGTAGATYVRFVFGLPFALVFLVLVRLATGLEVPALNVSAALWVAFGAVSQIFATGLMLATMRERSFVVTTAYIKTEPVQVALFGLIVLGEHLTGVMAAAILIATAGVMLMSWPKKGTAGDSEVKSWRPALLGLVSAMFFAFSAIGYRGGIIRLDTPSFVMASTTALCFALALQTTLIVALLVVTNRGMLGALARAWRPSLFAGFMGAFASQFWFLAFALTPAARVRTLALIEVIFAQIATRRVFKEGTPPRDLLGMAMILVGVGLLLNA